MRPSSAERRLRIGEAARAAGLAPRTLRYYEGIGVVRPAGRTSAGYRFYTEREVEVLRFVRRARRLGLSLAEARALVETWAGGEHPCGELDGMLRRRLGEIDARIRELADLREDVRSLLGAPSRTAGRAAVCPKLDRRFSAHSTEGRRGRSPRATRAG